MTRSEPTIRRHGPLAIRLHWIVATPVLVLLVSGLALGGMLPDWLVAATGGHGLVGALHRGGGLAFCGAAAALAVSVHRRALGLLRGLLGASRPGASVSIRETATCFGQDGARRFNLPQRLVLLALACAVVCAGASGVCLYFSSALPLRVFVVVIRTHVYSAWVALVLTFVHTIAGIGVLPSHRGVLGAMLPGGAVPVETARRLWPDWARRASKF